MIFLVLLLLGVFGALGQLVVPSTIPFKDAPLAMTVPFKGNPLTHDSAALQLNILANPWANIIKSTIPGRPEHLKKVVALLRPEVEIQFRANPLYVESQEQLCKAFGLACKKEEMMPEKKPQGFLVSPEKMCIEKGICSEEMKKKIMMMPPGQLCIEKGICSEEMTRKMMDPERWCIERGVCSEDMKRKLMDPEQLCIEKGICTEGILRRMMNPERLCFEKGICSEDMKRRLMDPEQLCFEKGICTEEILRKIMSPEKLCVERGVCTDEIIQKIKLGDPRTLEFLCTTHGIGCQELSSVSLFKIAKEEMNPITLCQTAGLGCKFLEENNLKTKMTSEKIPVMEEQKWMTPSSEKFSFLTKMFPSSAEISSSAEMRDQIQKGLWVEELWGDKSDAMM